MEQFMDFVGANPLLSAAWLALFVMLIYSFFSAGLRAYKLIGPQELTMLVNREEAQVLDIRSVDSFRKGHIAGAKNLLASKITENNKAELEKYSSHPIILVCESGMTANKACVTLTKLGFSSVYNLKGGMNEWRQANLPVATK